MAKIYVNTMRNWCGHSTGAVYALLCMKLRTYVTHCFYHSVHAQSQSTQRHIPSSHPWKPKNPHEKNICHLCGLCSTPVHPLKIKNRKLHPRSPLKRCCQMLHPSHVRQLGAWALLPDDAWGSVKIWGMSLNQLEWFHPPHRARHWKKSVEFTGMRNVTFGGKTKALLISNIANLQNWKNKKSAVFPIETNTFSKKKRSMVNHCYVFAMVPFRLWKRQMVEKSSTFKLPKKKRGWYQAPT